MKVSIVFEEGPNVTDGISFNVYLEGMSQVRREAIDRMTPDQQANELSTAEFWALRCFQITMHAMQQAGAVREVKRRK